MLIYLLPKINKNIYKHIKIQYSEEKPEPLISQSLSFYLNDTKCKITGCEEKWDIFKKYTNKYEYIHSHIPNKKICVSKYIPISRSYFKMIEIINEFKFGLDTPNKINTFHLAEGPGGFIEAVVNYRKNTILSQSTTKPPNFIQSQNSNDKDIYIGMTLLSSSLNKPNAESPPNWKKIQSFLKNNENIIIEKGADKTGNILSLNNLISINEKYGNTMDFITADGGFDFSTDFNNQETSMTQLIYGQIVFALCMQKQGGSFVLKIFDSFMNSTIDLLALLCSMYDNVYISKPHTSRSANSEKYIICKGFHHSNIQLYPYLFFSFKEMLEKNNQKKTPSFIKSFLNIPIPYYFLQKLEKYNGIIGEKQLNNIEQTFSLILKASLQEEMLLLQKKQVLDEKWKRNTINNYHFNVVEYNDSCNNIYCDKKEKLIQNNKEIDSLVKSNLLKCFHWCIKHNIPTE
jgi:23S rRNA U2552 (ribose-2'-O)-methylase RlmE/FtsJ